MMDKTSHCSVGEYLGKRWEQVGIRHYFTVPGDFNLVLLDQSLKNRRLQLVGCCNELNAGYAAEGYARSNGIGVSCFSRKWRDATRGPATRGRRIGRHGRLSSVLNTRCTS
jgi:Thiamine pyrophosphate enzyme, N-terminal TPP binding domain